jgi:RNase H-fold protein (predicted Holliday junction resolvase)
MQGLHILSSSSTVSGSSIQQQHPSTHIPTLKKQHNSNRLVRTLASKKKGKGTQQPKQQQPQQQQGTSFWEDPRLQWAKPEWIQQQTNKQVTMQQPQLQQQQSSSSGLGQLAAAARSNPLQRPAAKPGAQKPVITEQERQRVLQKMTYGSFNSTDEDDTPSSSSTSTAAVPQLFAALGIDFGEHRVGVAVRRAPYNIPLTILWTEAVRQAASSTSTTTSDGSSIKTSNITTSSSSSSSVDSSMDSSMDSSSSTSPPARRRVDFRKLADKLLQVALQEGCDGFVVGVPVLNHTAAPANALTTRPAHPAPGDLADADSAAVRGTKQLTENIRRFAQVLANAAADYELPVLLVNEQQSSQQARAIRAGRAAYDVITLAELQQLEQQQLQQQQQNLGQDSRQQQERRQQRQQEELQRPKQQQQQQAGQHSRKKREAVPGRDAYAAALILSRYYNGVVEPLEVVLASRPHKRQQHGQQQQEQ